MSLLPSLWPGNQPYLPSLTTTLSNLEIHFPAFKGLCLNTSVLGSSLSLLTIFVKKFVKPKMLTLETFIKRPSASATL